MPIRVKDVTGRHHRCASAQIGYERCTAQPGRSSPEPRSADFLGLADRRGPARRDRSDRDIRPASKRP
jgi:hypothetical protein